MIVYSKFFDFWFPELSLELQRTFLIKYLKNKEELQINEI
jgi:hypothetical protein